MAGRLTLKSKRSIRSNDFLQERKADFAANAFSTALKNKYFIIALLLLIVAVSAAAFSARIRSAFAAENHFDGHISGQTPENLKNNSIIPLSNPRARSENLGYERVCPPRTPIQGAHEPPSPVCSDTRFITEANNGTLQIEIDRYIGDKNQLIEKSENFTKGLIGKYAKLTLEVRFAAVQGGGVAKVIFNDKEVDVISGAANGTFSTPNVFVPIEYVKFPEKPGEPAINTINLQISYPTVAATVDWATLDINVARPALLIHGLDGDPTTWNNWLGKFDELGLDSNTVVKTVPAVSGCGTFAGNSAAIKAAIDEMRNNLKVDKVNLIGHSKGGIESRIVAKDYSQYISQVIQVGSPNSGSEWATRWERVVLSCPGEITEQVSIENMRSFNQSYTSSDTVKYTTLAGDYSPSSDIIPGRDDVFVSVASAHSLNAQNLTKLIHSSADPIASATHILLNKNNAVFDCLKPIFARLDGNTQNESLSCLAAETPPPANTQGKLPPKTGTIDQGQTIVEQINVDMATNVSFTLLYPSGRTGDNSPANNLNITLISPNGTRYPIPNNDREGLGGRIEQRIFASTITGLWQAEISAPTIVSGGSLSYGIFVAGDSPQIAFSGSFENSAIRAGQTLKILGTLRNSQSNTAITGATVSASVRIPTTPNPTTQIVTLYDNGTNGDTTANDGIYSFNFTNTNAVGGYSVQLTASKEASGSIPAFSRQDNKTASAALSGSTIASTFSDGGGSALTGDSGLATAPPYSKLIIQAGLNITNATNYIVLGEITDSAGNKINTVKQATLAAGAQTVALEFSGEQIYRNRVNGRFQLTSIMLFEDTANGRLLVNSRTNAYQTASYQFLDFQTRPVSAAFTGSAVGIDNNANGLFDLLRTTIQIDARQAGAYSWTAQLVDSFGTNLGTIGGSGNLTVGTNSLVFDFDGRRIGLNSVNGPYTISNLTVQGTGGSLVESNVLQTQAFTFGQFETCSLTISSPSGNFTAAGGQGSFDVTTQFGCLWDARSNASWITTTSSGFQSGTINFTVAPNSGIARTGSLSVGGRTFTVNQTTNCSYTLSPSSTQNVPAAASVLNISVATSAGCTWTAANNNNWLTLTSGFSGSGNGTISVSVSANDGALRTGIITVAGQSITVNQAADPANCLTSPAGLIASYKADGNANNVFGFSNGTLQNGATFTGGVRGQAFSFDGVDDRVFIPYSAAFSSASYTVETWVKPLAPVSDPINQEGIFGQTNGRMQLLVRGGTAGVIPVLSYRTASATFQTVVATAEIPLQSFSHIAGTYDGTTLRLYINGVLSAQATATLPPVNSTCDFWIGGFGSQTTSGSCIGATPQQFSNSAIDEINFYNRALSAAEISAIYNGRDNPFCNLVTRKSPVDFDGDGKTDVAIFRPAVGEWWYLRSSDNGNGALQFGASTDRIVPADFTGDGKTDIAFFRPSNGNWFILRSEDSSFLSFPFGAANDVPLVGDFDGDQKADPIIYRPSTSEWFILRSTGGTQITTFGISGDKPVPADYDGDGKTDFAIYRPSSGEWWISRSSNNSTYAFQFGLASDKPVPGDYTGDGKTDSAFWRPASGEWFILRSEDSSFYSVPFGANGDAPSPGDYDGDGKFDTTVFRPSTATWYSNRSTAGIMILTFGVAGDRSVSNAFVP